MLTILAIAVRRPYAARRNATSWIRVGTYLRMLLIPYAEYLSSQNCSMHRFILHGVTTPMKISLCLLFVPLWAFSFGQDALPCGVDNLSCPRTDPDSQPQTCFTVAELCEGNQFCPGGQDEGDHLAALNCEYSLQLKALIVIL